jgi:hypothetical protein
MLPFSDGKTVFFLSLEPTEGVRDTQPWLGDQTMEIILFRLLLLTDSFLSITLSYMWSLGFCDVMILPKKFHKKCADYKIFFNLL